MASFAPILPVREEHKPAVADWAQRIEVAAAREAAMTAVEAMRGQHPDWKLCRATIRANEPARFVVAVFYHLAGVPERPCPYRLVSVCRQSGQATEMLCRTAVPYLL